MPKKKPTRRRAEFHVARNSLHYEPPGWLSTEELEQELFRAIVAETRLPPAQARFEKIDAYFAADEPETEIQYRRSLLRLLADLRPQLAELVGGPRKCE
jgi:hypothetical protein